MDSSAVFYTKFAQEFLEYARKKDAYLSAVDAHICRNAGSPACMIDIGAGDGRRADRIRFATGARELVLVDNSAGMLSLSAPIAGATRLLADVSDPEFSVPGRYDLVLCLWNVLGHVASDAGRLAALRNMRQLLTPSGTIFLDVNNRYNVAQYGLFPVVGNVARDLFPFVRNSGDYPIRVETDGRSIATMVHLFSPGEMGALVRRAGLRINARTAIEYANGKTRPFVFQGQLLYSLSIL